MKSIVIWESLSILAGGQKVSLDILDALRDEYRCIFFVPEEGPLTQKLREKGVKYEIVPIGNYSIGKKGFLDILKLSYNFPRVFKEVYQYVKKNNIHLIYSNGARCFIWSSIIGSLLSVPVIWHVHSLFEDQKSVLILSQLGKLESVKNIIFVSNTAKSQFPSLSDKSTVVYNGINVDEVDKESSHSDIRNEFNIPQSKKIVSTISWIMKPKGQHILIKSIPYILNQYENVHFLVVGGIRERYETYYNLLRRDIKKMGIESHVTFTGHRNDVPSLLRKISMNSINSLESCPLIILEAACLGVPTIGPNIGGIPELIKNGKTGLIYKFGDEKDLAEKILMLLKNEDLYFMMRENCKAYVKEFDISKFNGQIKKIVEYVIGSL